MKRNRKIGVLLGVFLGVSLAALGVSRYEERKEQIKNSDEIILEVAREDVNALSWECDTGSFAFHREEDGSWLYDEDEAFPVDKEKIDGLLSLFEEFGVSFRIEEVEDFGQYGLDAPICTIRLETEEQTTEIQLGDYSAMDSERYVSTGDGNVYLVKEDPLDRFAVEISELIRHDEIPGFEEVTQVQFTGAESDRIIYEEDSTETYSGEDVYFMERGERRLALDTARVEDYLNTVKNLGLKEYVTYNASEEEIEEYGMDVPELSIQLDYTVTEEGSDEKTSGTFSLQIGRDPKEREKEKQNTGSKDNESGDDEIKDSEEDQTEEEDVKAYARVGESKIIYQITGQQFKKLMDISYNTLRHQEMFWRDFEDMYRLDIQLEGETCTITSELEEEKRVYYYGGEEVEMAGIRAGISGLRATGFTAEEPAQKEEIGLTIYLDNENHSEVTIQLYRYDGNKCIAVVDKESVAFVERTEVIDLVEAVHTIILDQNGAGTEGG